MKPAPLQVWVEDPCYRRASLWHTTTVDLQTQMKHAVAAAVDQIKDGMVLDQSAQRRLMIQAGRQARQRGALDIVGIASHSVRFWQPS